jgi:hypothetical protein
LQLEPLEVILHRKSILDTPNIGRKKKKPTPSRLSQLFRPGERFAVNSTFAVPPLQINTPNADEAL